MMDNINVKKAESLLSRWDVDVFPITLVKYLLNKRKILTYFRMASNPKNMSHISIMSTNNDDCKVCKSRQEKGMTKCRNHTAIERVFDASKVIYDLDTEAYIIKNEIFKQVGDYLVIVHCPYPLNVDLTDDTLRQVYPMTLDISDTKLPNFEKIQILSTDLMDMNISCGINRHLDIITIPRDRHGTDWILKSRE